MVSDASKKKAAQKKAAAAAKRGGKAAATSSKAASGVDKASDAISELTISDRTCTGVLCSHPLSRDIRELETLQATINDQMARYAINEPRKHKLKRLVQS